MSNPLIGTTWNHALGVGPPITILKESEIKLHAQDLRDDYIPAFDYTFKCKGYSSEYLLAGLRNYDEGLFLNTTKNNKQKHIDLTSKLTLIKSEPLSGLITGPYKTMLGVVTKAPNATSSNSTATASSASAVVGGTYYDPDQAFKDAMMKKMKSPERQCFKCKGPMTLLFTSFSCNNGCK